MQTTLDFIVKNNIDLIPYLKNDNITPYTKSRILHFYKQKYLKNINDYELLLNFEINKQKFFE